MLNPRRLDLSKHSIKIKQENFGKVENEWVYSKSTTSNQAAQIQKFQKPFFRPEFILLSKFATIQFFFFFFQETV